MAVIHEVLDLVTIQKPAHPTLVTNLTCTVVQAKYWSSPTKILVTDIYL